MRIALVTESFLPQVNGVTTSVLRLCEHLQLRGHEALVVAPGSGPTTWAGARVLRVPSSPFPGYSTHRVALPWPRLAAQLRDFAPDVVHLASPTVLGAQAVAVAESLGVPAIAVYQTDLAAYAARYHAPVASRALWRWLRWVHERATLTLAPSRHAAEDLRRHAVPRVQLWPRGVDLQLYTAARRDDGLRASLAPDGRLLVGYVGRLASEKSVDLLRAVHDLPTVQLVVVGDGPQRPALERLLPQARFLGQQHGEQLGALYAALDVFVHTGAHETFCQSAQEALASSVPVVAPAAGGLLDLVDDGVNGLLYEPGSGEGLRAAVEALIEDPLRRQVMAAAARRSVQGRSWESVGDAYLDYCRITTSRDAWPSAAATATSLTSPRAG